jgi:hypothetical protein
MRERPIMGLASKPFKTTDWMKNSGTIGNFREVGAALACAILVHNFLG